MDSGPTSRAVGRSKENKKKKMMTKSLFCRFPYLTLVLVFIYDGPPHSSGGVQHCQSASLV